MPVEIDLPDVVAEVREAFAVYEKALTLLADATGQTAGVGTMVPVPWTYEYQLPIDCVRARFVPYSQPQTPSSPQFTGSFPIVLGPPTPTPPTMTGIDVITPQNVQLVPARFLVTLDYNYPAVIGAITDWSQLPDVQQAEGVGPQQRTVVLTNVQNASLVYTALVSYPDEWDSLFQEAFVQILASRIALPLAKDKKFGLAMRAQAIMMAKEMVTEARVANGNESGFPQTTDHLPDFIRARTGGASWLLGGWNQNAGLGVLGYGWDAMGWADGSVF